MALGRRGGNTKTQFNVELKGVSKSTVAIGDSVAIHTPAGSRLIRTVGSEVVPEPRPRPSPVVRRPHRARAFVGRASEVAAAGQAGPGAPFQVHGADGVGKSALLEHLVFDLPQADDGVVHAKVRRRGVYDIQAQLFKAFWECAVRFTPAPEEMSDFLGDRRALVVLDDVGLDRSDLEELIDTSPGCTFVIGSEEQTLWSGSAVRLAGLDDEAALELIELRLDRRLAADERVSATAVVKALDGHPQRLVEAVAGVRGGSTSFAELAGGITWDVVGKARQALALTQAQRTILAVLRAADAPLGTERIAEFADVPDPADELAVLETNGWVRSASPRYRLTSELQPTDGKLPEDEFLRRLTEWAKQRASPEEVADEAEAIETALDRKSASAAKVTLARAAEGKLALAGMLDSWGRVLNAGLDASRDPHDQAYMLHQLGTREGLVGQDESAIEHLERALELREDLGDEQGAEVTRHNLRQLGGGGTHGLDGDGGNGGGPARRPRSLSPLLAVLAVVVVGAAIYGVATDGDPGPDVAAVKPPQAPATGPPKVRVDAPARGARYAQGERVLAAYGCAAAHDAHLRSCRGSVPSGSAIDTSEGRHEFRVVARDSNGRREEITIPYSVTGSSAPPTQADETRPTIRLTTPAEGGVYAAKSQITADFACLDERGGSGMKSCSATVADGELIDTSPGAHEFKVTAVDRAGNTRSETVQYRVERSSPRDTTDPEITITMPAANASYDLSQTVLAAYACDDGEGSGIETCEGSVGVGEPIDTATVGEHTFRVTAEDGAGNRTERSVTYDVEAVVAR